MSIKEEGRLQSVGRNAMVLFKTLLQGTLDVVILKHDINYEWQYNGSVDKCSHISDAHDAWLLPNGGRIRICMRPCVNKGYFKDGVMPVACCKLLADCGFTKVLALTGIENGEWREVNDVSMFDVIDEATHPLQWGSYKIFDMDLFLKWVSSCDNK